MKTEKTMVGRVRSGFTLIEMIGVMAVMAILAAVITPNILHSIELAAVKAEKENLQNFGSAMNMYLHDKGNLPTEGNNNWNAQIAPYASLNTAAILTNSRQAYNVPGVTWVPRIFVIDPVAANQRAMIISSMRYQVTLPSLATLHTNFATIWNSADNTVPLPTSAWPGWGAGPAPALDNIEYLVIERVSFAAMYHSALASYTWTLNNNSTTHTVSCIATWADGSTPTTYTLTAAAAPTTQTPARKLKPGDKLAFYTSATPGVVFSYVASDSGRTFTYATTTYWTAQ